VGEQWYRGTADSVFQNIHMVEEFRADAILVFGADHIYKMNIRQMTDFHFQKGAMATIACLPIKKSEANQFGIVQVDEQWRVVGFQEKPEHDPVTIPGDPEHCLGSMGNYVFAPGPLIEELRADAERDGHRATATFHGFPIVTVRPNAFKRCLGNLVSNAARFGSTIEITGHRDHRYLTVTVDDDGTGIPLHLREEVFKPFLRLDDTRNQDEGGSGLGLAIARDIARSHGGDIMLGDSPLGGLRATVRVPV
jgi:hypothetical protein